MPRWIRWMVVDSSGSMKLPASPSATQFRLQHLCRWPGRNLTGQGFLMISPSRLDRKSSRASSSLVKRLE